MFQSSFQKGNHIKMKQLVKKTPVPQRQEQAVQKVCEQLETVKQGTVAETQLKYVLKFKKWNLKKTQTNPTPN